MVLHIASPLQRNIERKIVVEVQEEWDLASSTESVSETQPSTTSSFLHLFVDSLSDTKDDCWSVVFVMQAFGENRVIWW